MGNKRYNSISRSIQLALYRDPNEIKKTILSYVLAFFTIFRIRLVRFGYELFRRLRDETWEIDEEEYRCSFLHKKGSKSLEPMGDLGYSGSVSYAVSFNHNKDRTVVPFFIYLNKVHLPFENIHVLIPSRHSSAHPTLNSSSRVYLDISNTLSSAMTSSSLTAST